VFDSWLLEVSVCVIITCLLSIVPVLLRMPYLFAKQSTRDVGSTVSLPLLLPLPLPLTNKGCPEKKLKNE
jgi:hypothetical protein